MGLLLLGCTREVPKDSRVSIQVPFSQKSDFSSSSTDETLDDPEKITDMNCYLFTIANPDASKNPYLCEMSDGSKVRFESFYGFTPANGQSISFQSPVGKNKSLKVFGSKASNATCPQFPVVNVTQNLSNTFQVGVKDEVNLVPGDNAIEISISYNPVNTSYIQSCVNIDGMKGNPALKYTILGQSKKDQLLNLETGVEAPTDILHVNGIYYVVDQANNRILGFNGTAPSAGVKPDFVLGQKNLSKRDRIYPPTASSLADPWRIATDGVRLAVADYTNDRVLIWNQLPTTTNQPADIVVGQPSFTSYGYSVANKANGALNNPQ
ncbi:MAG: hypothetical protein GW917_03065, partial [Bdellovibrionales bacterium]|nr:hypothetical protein [Bdellovibrionales bacterium]